MKSTMILTLLPPHVTRTDAIDRAVREFLMAKCPGIRVYTLPRGGFREKRPANITLSDSVYAALTRAAKHYGRSKSVVIHAALAHKKE